MSLSQQQFADLREAYVNIYAPKFETILDELTDEEVDEISDELIEEVVEEFFAECLEEGWDTESVEETLCESLDASIQTLNESVLMEMNPYAPAGSKESRAYNKASTASKRTAERAAKRKEVIGKVKGAVKEVGSALKSGAKAAAKGAVRGAGYAAGAAKRAGSVAKSEFKKGYESASKSSSSDSEASDSGSSASSSASSSSGSSSSGKTRKAVGGALRSVGRLLKRGLKKAVGGTARAVSKGADKVATRLGEDYIDENVMSGPVMKSGSGLGGAKPVYPADKAPKATGAKLPTLQKAGYELEGESLRESGLFSEEEIAAILEASERIEEARRADKEGHSRGTAANPSRKDVPHSDPSQRSMLHSRIKSRSDQMGRDRRGSERNQSGGRTPVSNKEKSFLKAKDRTARSVRNPNVPDTGSHTEWPSQRRKQKDPKQNPKHNANK